MQYLKNTFSEFLQIWARMSTWTQEWTGDILVVKRSDFRLIVIVIVPHSQRRNIPGTRELREISTNLAQTSSSSEDELIGFWWSRVNVTVTSQNPFLNRSYDNDNKILSKCLKSVLALSLSSWTSTCWCAEACSHEAANLVSLWLAVMSQQSFLSVSDREVIWIIGIYSGQSSVQ